MRGPYIERKQAPKTSARTIAGEDCHGYTDHRSCLADVMLVFGDVGELRKVAEGTDDLDIFTMREAIQCRLELVPRGFIFFAVEADRGPANVLNDREDRLAFLAADRIAKNAAKKTDIVT
jgi:hypothetical protein